MVGKPVVKGTRIPVEMVLGQLAYNLDPAELFAIFPEACSPCSRSGARNLRRQRYVRPTMRTSSPRHVGYRAVGGRGGAEESSSGAV